MNDKELLELAAKAAGINLHVWGTKGKENYADMGFAGSPRIWNPLTDDGDALRLAVKLGLEVSIFNHSGVPHTWVREIAYLAQHVEEAHGDPYAATRRAIVRAAAEIGKG